MAGSVTPRIDGGTRGVDTARAAPDRLEGSDEAAEHRTCRQMPTDADTTPPGGNRPGRPARQDRPGRAARRSAPARCHFLPYSQRDNVPARAAVYDVSSYGDDPWCQFSPMWAHGGIPVPGMPG